VVLNPGALRNSSGGPDPNQGLYGGVRIAWGIVGLCLYAVFARFLLSLARRRRAQPIHGSVRVVAIAIICASLFFFGLANGWSWEDFRDSASPWFAPIMGGISLIMLWLACKPSATDSTPRCERCGYNLTANTSGICPECGQAIATPAPSL
jgi:hypothetical protein